MDRRDFLKGVSGAAAAAALPAIPLAAAAPEFLYAYPTPVHMVSICHTVFWASLNNGPEFDIPTSIWRSKRCACYLPEGPTERET